MALPKRKISRTRRDKRRTHWKLTAPTFAKCPHCSAVVTAHRACTACGYYNGQKVPGLKPAKESRRTK